MTLCDAGPLIALISTKDRKHRLCADTFSRLSLPLITTWPCLAEAMHLAFRERGYSGQEVLWDFFDGGILQLHTSNENERLRMRVLMKQYSDTPMDLADASLVVAAETLGTKVIFTLDSDFHVYRLTNGEGFEVLP